MVTRIWYHTGIEPWPMAETLAPETQAEVVRMPRRPGGDAACVGLSGDRPRSQPAVFLGGNGAVCLELIQLFEFVSGAETNDVA